MAQVGAVLVPLVRILESGIPPYFNNLRPELCWAPFTTLTYRHVHYIVPFGSGISHPFSNCVQAYRAICLSCE